MRRCSIWISLTFIGGGTCKYHINYYQGSGRLTNKISHLKAYLLNLDKNRFVMLRYWVETGNILIGKLTPQLAKATNQTWEEQQE
jgi:DNA-directed RNA polymerase beta subunit